MGTYGNSSPNSAPTSSMDAPPAPAGWFPITGARLRYWNGQAWTDNYAADPSAICRRCGHTIDDRSVGCTECAAPPTPVTAVPAPYLPHPTAPAVPQEKSVNIALALDIFFPGAGMQYLGYTREAVPFLIANAIGLFCVLTLSILIPIGILIWLVTVIIVAPKTTDRTAAVNASIRASYGQPRP